MNRVGDGVQKSTPYADFFGRSRKAFRPPGRGPTPLPAFPNDLASRLRSYETEGEECVYVICPPGGAMKASGG